MKTIIFTIIFAAAGFLLLNFAGGIFIKEVTQEILIAEPSAAIEAEDVVGKKAPFWDLPDLNGDRILLTDFVGKPLVLTFWTTWNELSADQFAILNKLYSEPGFGKIFNIVAINNQEPKGKVFNFVSRGGYIMPVLLDELGVVGQNYELHQTPTTYFIDKNGQIGEVFVGILDEKSIVDKVEKIIK